MKIDSWKVLHFYYVYGFHVLPAGPEVARGGIVIT